MINNIKLLTINELLEKNFFIPCYQRGYKWEKKQIEDLLEDLFLFAKDNKDNDRFYCLQPIVVKKCTEETKNRYQLESSFTETYEKDEKSFEEQNVWYEVVDGQQRLTTLKILFLYFIKNHIISHDLKDVCFKDLFNLRYETRPDTEKFFNNLISDNPDPNLNNDYIDFDFISTAYNVIEKWFVGDFLKANKIIPNNARNSILSLLTETKEQNTNGTAQVIWYEINDEDDPIETFSRLNIGKIPLTNSELIKALFLQKSKFENNKSSGKSFTSQVTSRQIEIATEWDRIEYQLQNDEFWYFLNGTENKKPARIEFLFDTICDIETANNESLKKKIGNDEDRTFRFFADKILPQKQKISNEEDELKLITKLWEGDTEKGITDYFRVLEDWYNNPVYYHYVGFLIYCGKTVKDIFELYDGNSKDKFLFNLKSSIKSILSESNITYSIDNDNYLVNNLYYKKGNSENTKMLRKFYLLLNIQYIINQQEQSYIRFPFDKFKSEETKWDIEHIDSYTENDITDKEEQKKWLYNCLEVIDELKLNQSFEGNIIKEIKLYNDKIDNLKLKTLEFIPTLDSERNQKDKFDELRKEIITCFNEDGSENSEYIKNSVGNLTLLDSNTNRSYGNSLFPFKRKEIIRKDSEGQFIPICTKYVFLKYYNDKGTALIKWTQRDINLYTKFIINTLIDFLDEKKEENIDE